MSTAIKEKIKEKKHTNNIAVYKTEEMNTELEALVKQYEEAVKLEEHYKIIKERCLGGIEITRKFIGEEEPDNSNTTTV